MKWIGMMVVLSWICGCIANYTLVKDFGSRKPHTVAVLPMLNETNDLDAPREIRPLVYNALTGRGYRVRSLKEVDALLKSREIREAGQIYTMTFRELGDLLEVDALLVSTVLDWSTVYLIYYSSVTVEAKFQLIDVRSEKILWEYSDKVSKRKVATDKNSLVETLKAAIKTPYSSLAKVLIGRCFNTLPYGQNYRRPKKIRKRKFKIFLPPGKFMLRNFKVD